MGTGSRPDGRKFDGLQLFGTTWKPTSFGRVPESRYNRDTVVRFQRGVTAGFRNVPAAASET